MIARDVTTRSEPFPVREETINGIRVRVYDCEPRTLLDVLEASALHGGADYLVFEDERYSFGECFELVAGLSHYLVTEHQIGKGDRVAIAMRNYPEFVFFFWAALAAGAIAVPLNAWWTDAELRHALGDSGAVFLAVDDERLERVEDHIASSESSLRGVVSVRSDRVVTGVTRFADLRTRLRSGPGLPAVAVGPDDVATILYTSGTTGSSMGVPSTHRNHCSNVITTRHLGSAGFSDSASTAAGAAVQGGVAAHMPLFHISALGSVYLSALSGSKIVLMRKWDTEVALELIERERLTSFSGVPMQVQSLFDSPSFRSRDLSSLKTLGFAGTAIAPEMVLRVKRVFGGRVVARTGYGMTEATSAVSFITGEEYWDHPDSVGRPIPIDDIRIVDGDGHDVLPGQAGEVWVKGPNVVHGYWNQPEASAEKFTDGWHHSGDVGQLDDAGRLRIVDRLKDVVIRAGENIYCGQVEAVLLEHPGVHTAIVLGIPHERLGEEVVAVIRLEPGWETTTEEGLRLHASKQLAHFKVPSRFVFIESDVPRTPTGKVLKRVLRDQIATEAASSINSKGTPPK